MNDHFWHFARYVISFFIGGMLMSMLALQLSPSHREAVRELSQIKEDMRALRTKHDGVTQELDGAGKKLRLAEKQVGHAQGLVQSEHQKLEAVEARLSKHKDDVKKKQKELERINLERTQAIKKEKEGNVELDKVRKSLSVTNLKHEQEKKDCDLKMLEFNSLKEESTKWKKLYQETNDKLERLRLEHDQVKKDEKELEGSVETLTKKVKVQETDNLNLKQKLVSAESTASEPACSGNTTSADETMKGSLGTAGAVAVKEDEDSALFRRSGDTKGFSDELRHISHGSPDPTLAFASPRPTAAAEGSGKPPVTPPATVLAFTSPAAEADAARKKADAAAAAPAKKAVGATSVIKESLVQRLLGTSPPPAPPAKEATEGKKR